MKRRVTKSKKDKSGDIIGLCSSESWSPRAKADVISDIESKLHSYYVNEAGFETAVEVITRADKTKFLRTSADTTNENNLDNLPNC